MMNLRISLAQINPVMGAFESNKNRILKYAKMASEQSCDLVVFPESCLFGYPPFDLLERKDLVETQVRCIREIHRLWPANLAGLFGVLTLNPEKKGRPYYNSAVWIEKAKPLTFFHKQLLPTGDVFDEARFIEAGEMKNNFKTYRGHKFFITICEDIWAWTDKDGESYYKQNPIEKLRNKKVDCVLNLSASPFYPRKIEVRRELVAKTAKHFRAPMIYVNTVGAQDELIFDGGSLVVNASGKCLHTAKRFEEDFVVCDFKKKPEKPRRDSTSILRQALVLGIKDFCEKTGLKKVHLGLSGGIDSAVVACLAAEALGPSNVQAFALPGPYSATESFDLAAELAQNLGIGLKKFSIDSIYSDLCEKIQAITEFTGLGVPQENLQSRIRGLILMAISNSENSLLLSTSNKSEHATGYSTLYGDMCGGLSPLGDLTKAQVYEIAKSYGMTIPEQILLRPPTAELRPDQKDTDSLPSYEELDQAVVKIVELNLNAKSTIEKWLLERVGMTEFKRWQASPILKVSKRAFGRGRRWPIVNKATIGK